MATLDVTIWHYEKMAMATKDSPSLRLIAWNLLHRGIQAKLGEPPFADFQWQLLIDDRNTLRYQHGGLKLISNQGMFGDAASSIGETVISLYQSVWTEAFWLELQIACDVPFVPSSFDHVVAHCADADDDWEIENEPHFTATLDLEESLLIDPSMTIEDLSKWIIQIVQKTMDAILFIIGTNNPEKS
ncbi:hypothetical protein [Methylomonas sp. MK1]|uniref:hypothetical protein n=1 Tax=Methylomonas sp. MK1 TaxID=1131552 RepID=UPI0003742446|nr:hypothetical protein [Methylomonas sp. MK1]